MENHHFQQVNIYKWGIDHISYIKLLKGIWGPQKRSETCFQDIIDYVSLLIQRFLTCLSILGLLRILPRRSNYIYNLYHSIIKHGNGQFTIYKYFDKHFPAKPSSVPTRQAQGRRALLLSVVKAKTDSTPRPLPPSFEDGGPGQPRPPDQLAPCSTGSR